MRTVGVSAQSLSEGSLPDSVGALLACRSTPLRRCSASTPPPSLLSYSPLLLWMMHFHCAVAVRGYLYVKRAFDSSLSDSSSSPAVSQRQQQQQRARHEAERHKFSALRGSDGSAVADAARQRRITAVATAVKGGRSAVMAASSLWWTETLPFLALISPHGEYQSLMAPYSGGRGEGVQSMGFSQRKSPVRGGRAQSIALSWPEDAPGDAEEGQSGEEQERREDDDIEEVA